ncbi:MAG: T9SS type A sorting domain-containing protein, partial [bacterium]
NDVQSINYANVQAGYELRQSGSSSAGWELARAPQAYAYAIVAADQNYGPIIEMCDGLPPYIIFAEDVMDLGVEALGNDAEISTLYYLNATEYWYEVGNNQQSVVVNPRRMMTVSIAEFNVWGSFYDEEGNPTAAAYWSLLLSAEPLPELDDSGYIGGVPNFNQVDTDCGPHSTAQAVGYWDNHAYLGQGPFDLLIDADFWGLRDEMRAAMGWTPGSGVWPWDVSHGVTVVCNDPAYNNNYLFDTSTHIRPFMTYGTVTGAVDGGRPGCVSTAFHPVYGNHFMTVVGYNDDPTEMIQVHDNWPPDNDEPWLEWSLLFTSFVDIFPGMPGPTVPITVSSFSGDCQDGTVELCWMVACEAGVYGYNLLRQNAVINPELIPVNSSAAETHSYSYTDVQTSSGEVIYELQTVYLDGRTEISAQLSLQGLRYELTQNIPNPFNPITTIRFTVPESGDVNLVVYDVTGALVAILLDGYRVADSYEVVFDGSNLASGVYIYRLMAGDFTATGKMVLLK